MGANRRFDHAALARSLAQGQTDCRACRSAAIHTKPVCGSISRYRAGRHDPYELGCCKACPRASASRAAHREAWAPWPTETERSRARRYAYPPIPAAHCNHPSSTSDNGCRRYGPCQCRGYRAQISTPDHSQSRRFLSGQRNWMPPSTRSRVSRLISFFCAHSSLDLHQIIVAEQRVCNPPPSSRQASTPDLKFRAFRTAAIFCACDDSFDEIPTSARCRALVVWRFLFDFARSGIFAPAAGVDRAFRR